MDMQIHRILTAALLLSIAASAPASADVCSTSSSFPYLCQGNKHYGDSSFGAGYALKTGFATKRNYDDFQISLGLPPLPLPADYVWTGAAFGADVTVFGKHQDLVEAELSGRYQNGSASARVLARVLGTTLIDRRYASVSTVIPLYGVGAKVSKGFDWGVVSAEIEAQALVGIVFGLTVSGAGGLSITGAPDVSASVAFSADVDVGCSASVDGSLTLLSIRTPVTATLDLAHIADDELAVTINADLVLEALKGHLGLGVQCIGSYDFDLLDYAGVTFGPYHLFGATKTISL